MTEKSCSTAPSLHCQSTDLLEMNTQEVSSGKVLRFTAARKITKMRTQQPGAEARVAQHARKKEHEHQLKQPYHRPTNYYNSYYLGIRSVSVSVMIL